MDLPEGTYSAELNVSGSKKQLSLTSGQTPTATLALYWGAKPQPQTLSPIERVKQLLDEAKKLVEAGRLPEALKKVHEAQALEPDNDQARILEGQIQRRCGLAGVSCN